MEEKMGKSYNRFLIILISLLVCILLLFTLFHDKTEKTTFNSVDNKISQTREYSNIDAFSKVYGYVRYFHPSDEGAQLNWERFAIYGISKVKNAKSESELKARLEELFLPIAPTMGIYYKNEKIKMPKNIKNGEVVAWQHYGPPEDPDLYKSKRVTANLSAGKYTLEKEKLFSSFPKINETINNSISDQLVCSIPLVLYKDITGTLGSSQVSRDNFKMLMESIEKMDRNDSSENENVRYAGVIVTWNMLNHFYPYFDVTDSDWENQLGIALKDASDDKNRNDYISTLLKLMEKTKDGHATFSFDQFKLKEKRLPIILDMVENNVVVTVASQDSPFNKGDIVLSINGKGSQELVEELSKEIPGSVQWKTYRALKEITNFDTATIKIRRGEQLLELNTKSTQIRLDEFGREDTFKEVEDGVFYFDLGKDVQSKFEENIDVLSNAKGIIYDLRGYPSFPLMQKVVGHLTEKPVKGPILRVMQTIYPDQENVTFDEVRVTIESMKPFFEGKVIFLSYAGTGSRPEYFLGYIKDNHLGQIIGHPTAGADGEIQNYSIPGNLNGTMTGMVVLNADRSQTHTIGILPDVEVKRTLEGVSKGKDEYIEAALKLINNNK
ncbi:S41 family peptidase [Neobacillus sp. NPDC058068]|uniref:S41 family peptidase n=1 Tax=Neobacillus sp. NPDC058068 TaxID=3346325 RepID=UPI0036DAD9DE